MLEPSLAAYFASDGVQEECTAARKRVEVEEDALHRARK